MRDYVCPKCGQNLQTSNFMCRCSRCRVNWTWDELDAIRHRELAEKRSAQADLERWNNAVRGKGKA